MSAVGAGADGFGDDLRPLLGQFRRGQQAGDPVNALDEHYEQGYNLVSSREAQAAFDIHRESDRIRDSYGRNPFGQRALLARRLVEAGVPFITLYDGGWDHHVGVFDKCRERLPSWDSTVATLIEDLDQRGLLATTLVIALGEFGRTPQVNKDSGRDHWSNAMSVLMAGAGIRGGQVIGATDRQGYAAVEHGFLRQSLNRSLNRSQTGGLPRRAADRISSAVRIECRSV